MSEIIAVPGSSFSLHHGCESSNVWRLSCVYFYFFLFGRKSPSSDLLPANRSEGARTRTSNPHSAVGKEGPGADVGITSHLTFRKKLNESCPRRRNLIIRLPAVRKAANTEPKLVFFFSSRRQTINTAAGQKAESPCWQQLTGDSGGMCENREKSKKAFG